MKRILVENIQHNDNGNLVCSPCGEIEYDTKVYLDISCFEHGLSDLNDVAYKCGVKIRDGDVIYTAVCLFCDGILYPYHKYWMDRNIITDYSNVYIIDEL